MVCFDIFKQPAPVRLWAENSFNSVQQQGHDPAAATRFPNSHHITDGSTALPFLNSEIAIARLQLRVYMLMETRVLRRVY